MIQRINLLQAIPQKITDHYSGEKLACYFGFFAVAIAAYSIFLVFGYYSMTRNIHLLDDRSMQLTASITEATQHPEFIKLKKMEADLALLNNKITTKKQIIDLLSNKSLFNTSGFSAYMEGFAKAIVKGVWLTHIGLEKGGTHISLVGKTTSSALVPMFVKNLENNPSFAHIQFNIENINDDIKDTSDNSSFLIKGVIVP